MPTRRGRIRRYLMPYLFIAPLLVTIAALLLYPILYAVFLSFTSVQMVRFDQPLDFVGLRNYARVAGDPQFFPMLKRSLVYTFSLVSGTFVLGFLSACLLHVVAWGRRAFRVLLIIPWGVPAVAASLMWIHILDPQMGVLNFLLERARLIAGPVRWLDSAGTAMTSVLIVRSWLAVPFVTLTVLGGLQTVPEELMEAATIDGANARQRFWHVMWPSLRPVTTVVVLLLTIWALKDFDVIYVLTEGGPAWATTTLSIETYLSAFNRFDFGRAAAVGSLSLVVSMLFTALYGRFVLYRREE